MGFFDKIFASKRITLLSPVDGTAVPISGVPDPTFSGELLGKGIAFLPAGDTVYAPCSGKIDLMFETGHAVSMVSEEGAEILIHIGLETVNLKGKYFTVLAATGDAVSAGQPLIRFDREAIAAAGYETVTPMVICNSPEFRTVSFCPDGPVRHGEPAASLTR